MNTCETCKHWQSRIVYDGYGTCSIADSDEGPDESNLAYAKDAECYSACLYTKPNFGCVQWEAKP